MSAKRNSTPGRGTPQEPGFTGPSAGVKVPVGEVSVMPQPSHSRTPASAWNRSCTSSGSGAPPEEQTFSEARASRLTPGRFSTATNMVGTPQNTVTFFSAMSFTTAAGSKRVCSTSSAPSDRPSSMLTDKA